MAKRSTASSPIGLDILKDTLLLDGATLLDRVTLVLHQHFDSHCTCVIEIDKLHYSAQTLSYACDNSIQQDINYQIKSTPCEQIGKSHQDYCLYSDNVSEAFPNDNYIYQNNIRGYLGIPLKTQSGEVLGILLSTYTEPLTDSSDVVYYHQMFANVIVHSLRSKWLMERSDSLVNQLSYEVSHDNLTNLMNRSYLSDRLEVMTENSNTPFTLAYIDIDNFKSINDLYGNYIGDQVIKFVADALTSVVPENNLSFRIAGDEFAFITHSPEPLQICRSLVSKLEQGYVDSSHDIKVSVSIGIARKSEAPMNPDQLILNASLALKDCKRSRQTNIQCYDTHLSAKYYRRTQIIDALRHELSKPRGSISEIYVATQPIVHREHKRWDYFEILARWTNPHLGTISPIEFIEAAEQSGLIIELGERIVELACAAKLELENGLGYKVKLGLNCSAHELNDSGRYLEHLTNTIQNYGFKANEFVIELTETVLLSRTDEVRFVLDKLRNLGFTVALDDFGTGYSSLNYIHSYPIDCIKIDATFIRNMLNNETSERVVWLIIQLAQQLNVDLVAEGVEDQEALEKLYSMGCKQIQGYYFSRPETPLAIINHYFNIKNTRTA
ncbi:EAL domain-containing protein [Vibrio sp. SCSIO 43135]|uniref:EAL domain-containing protein n=1 Tax=Vibrio paucivorans TaxID=2829489 RepID=A0A9X3CB55_9VIBR|nr:MULTISPECIES: GGDEF domain-containing phosphodiesterase [Vibrio]MCW8332416.1 EAL domain-containing protein [Vibrio paucivorans]USD43677.1 EAL domain-containing protein [Vibrio sp. SCSIO 43135]